jgi:hypothetical protein
MRAAGMLLYTIGLGADVDEGTLVAMAGGQAQYRFAPRSTDLAEIYAEIARDIRCPTTPPWPRGMPEAANRSIAAGGSLE